MIKAIIIDDEPLARQVVKEYLETYPMIDVLTECNDGFEAVKVIAEHQPDLIFLDIQMPKINGFEMLELLEEPPTVIFTTAFDEYAIRAFEANAIDYLLKPFSKERFDGAVKKFLDQNGGTKSKLPSLIETVQQDQELHRIVIKDGSKIRIIPLYEIVMLEAADDYVKIHSTGGVYLKKKTMQSFEMSLPDDQFIRLHRSFIVNITQITRIEPFEKESHIAMLKAGPQVPVSKSGYQKLKEILDL